MYYIVLRCIFVLQTLTMTQSNKSEAIVVRVDAELKAKLQVMADNDNRSLSDFIRVQLIKLAESQKSKK